MRIFQRIALCSYLIIVAGATYAMFTIDDVNGQHMAAYGALLATGAPFVFKVWSSNPNCDGK